MGWGYFWARVATMRRRDREGDSEQRWSGHVAAGARARARGAH